jgi:hypothetical protein
MGEGGTASVHVGDGEIEECDAGIERFGWGEEWTDRGPSAISAYDEVRRFFSLVLKEELVLTDELTGGDGLEFASPLNGALIERIDEDLT